MGEVKASADIETEYLMAKNKNNFDHPAENGIRIKVCVAITSKLSDNISN
jgi:hypothetical protein